MKPNVYRARINQPGALQPLHDHDGEYCIAVDYGDPGVDIYFTEGAVHSMRVPRICISRAYLSDAKTTIASFDNRKRN